jgi:cadmium resistance protein CadD (predicted permease)
MDMLPATAAAAAGLFAATNVDDMLVLAVLSASARATGRPRRWQIWAGQYAGIAILVVLSLGAGRGAALVPGHWIWLLGLLPLALGLRKLLSAINAHRSGRQLPTPAATGLAGIIGLTIANGGDNVAAYTPVFATSSSGAIAITLTVFAFGVALWCQAGSWLVSHHRTTGALERWGQWIIPAVYILIAVNVFYKTGVFGH